MDSAMQQGRRSAGVVFLCITTHTNPLQGSCCDEIVARAFLRCFPHKFDSCPEDHQGNIGLECLPHAFVVTGHSEEPRNRKCSSSFIQAPHRKRYSYREHTLFTRADCRLWDLAMILFSNCDWLYIECRTMVVARTKDVDTTLPQALH